MAHSLRPHSAMRRTIDVWLCMRWMKSAALSESFCAIWILLRARIPAPTKMNTGLSNRYPVYVMIILIVMNTHLFTRR